MARLAQEQGGTLIVCHSKAAPLTKLPSPQYEDVVTEVRDVPASTGCGSRWPQGLAPERIVVDPGHDLNKNTYHSLEITRRLGELATLGYPLLAAVSNKDFIQETLDLPKDRLLAGTPRRTCSASCRARGSCACTTSPARCTRRA